jgi:hypothetical protein
MNARFVNIPNPPLEFGVRPLIETSAKNECPVRLMHIRSACFSGARARPSSTIFHIELIMLVNKFHLTVAL